MNRTMQAQGCPILLPVSKEILQGGLLLTAPIVYSLPVLTLRCRFSQEGLYNHFSYLKLSLTHSKAYFNLVILENNLKLKCY